MPYLRLSGFGGLLEGILGRDGLCAGQRLRLTHTVHGEHAELVVVVLNQVISPGRDRTPGPSEMQTIGSGPNIADSSLALLLKK